MADDILPADRWEQINTVLRGWAEKIASVCPLYNVERGFEQVLHNRVMRADVDHGSNLGTQAQVSYVCPKCYRSQVKQKDWANDKSKKWMCVFCGARYQASLGDKVRRLVLIDTAASQD